MNAKMKKGVSVREHVLNMINLMHEAEIHGAIIDERNQVSIILESFTLAFSQFTTNYVMNKLQYNMCDAPNPGGPLTTRQPAETLVNVE